MTTDIEKFFYAEYKKYIKRNPGISIYWIKPRVCTYKGKTFYSNAYMGKNVWDYYHPDPIDVVYMKGFVNPKPDQHLWGTTERLGSPHTIPTPFLKEFLRCDPKDPFSFSKKHFSDEEIRHVWRRQWQGERRYHTTINGEIPIMFKSFLGAVEQIILDFFDKKNIDCLILPLESTKYFGGGGELDKCMANSPWRFVAAGEAAKEGAKTIKPTSFAKVVGINTKTDKIKILSKSKEMWNLAKAFEDFICFCKGRDYYYDENWQVAAHYDIEPNEFEFFYDWAIIYRDKSNKINFIEQEMMSTDNTRVTSCEDYGNGYGNHREHWDYPIDGNFGNLNAGFPFLPDTDSEIQEKFPALFNLLMKFKVLFPSVA